LNPFEIKKKIHHRVSKKEGDFGEAKKVIIFGEDINYILTQKRPFNVKPSFQRVSISTGKIFKFFCHNSRWNKKKLSTRQDSKTHFLFKLPNFSLSNPLPKEVWFKMLQNDER